MTFPSFTDETLYSGGMTIHNKTHEPKIIAPALAISLALTAYFLFTAGDTLGKWLQGSYNAAEIIVAINVVGFVVMSGVAIYMRGAKDAFKSKKWKLHIVRGVIISTSTIMVFFALRHMPLSDFYGIVFLNPLWVALLSFIFLKEKIPPSRLIAIMVGFLGVLVIAGAEFATFNIGFLAALGVSILGAIGALLARHIGGTESPTTFCLATHATMALMNLPMALPNMHMPTLHDGALMLLYGCIMSTALLFTSLVFSRSHSVSQVAPLQYTQMLWGILLGWMVFGNTPTMNVLAGALLVISAGAYVMKSLRRGRLMNR